MVTFDNWTSGATNMHCVDAKQHYLKMVLVYASVTFLTHILTPFLACVGSAH